jgi:hypothetical protein
MLCKYEKDLTEIGIIFPGWEKPGYKLTVLLEIKKKGHTFLCKRCLKGLNEYNKIGKKDRIEREKDLKELETFSFYNLKKQ